MAPLVSVASSFELDGSSSPPEKKAKITPEFESEKYDTGDSDVSDVDDLDESVDEDDDSEASSDEEEEEEKLYSPAACMEEEEAEYIFGGPDPDDLPDEVLCEELHKNNKYPDDSEYVGKLREMTEEEEKRYHDQITKSDGFEVDRFPNVIGFCMIKPACLSPGFLEYYVRFARAAVRFENRKPERKDKKLKLTGIIKTNVLDCGRTADYYFTLKAEDNTGESKVYEAKVCEFIPLYKTQFPIFRLKGTH